MLDVMSGSCWRSCWGHVGCHVGIMLGGCFFGVFEGCLDKKTTGPEGQKLPSRKKSDHRSRGTIEGKKIPSRKKSDNRSRGTSRSKNPKSKKVSSKHAPHAHRKRQTNRYSLVVPQPVSPSRPRVNPMSQKHYVNGATYRPMNIYQFSLQLYLQAFIQLNLILFVSYFVLCFFPSFVVCISRRSFLARPIQGQRSHQNKDCTAQTAQQSFHDKKLA